jgi:hypothetical protein
VSTGEEVIDEVIAVTDDERLTAHGDWRRRKGSWLAFRLVPLFMRR